jgi:hypothetical protein
VVTFIVEILRPPDKNNRLQGRPARGLQRDPLMSDGEMLFGNNHDFQRDFNGNEKAFSELLYCKIENTQN